MALACSLEKLITLERPMVGAAVVRKASLKFTEALLQKVPPKNARWAMAQASRNREPMPRISWA